MPETEVRRRLQEGELPDGTTAWSEGMDHRLPVPEALLLLREIAEGVEQNSKDDSLPELKTFAFIPFCKDIFRRHSIDEITDLFCCGSRTTTPPISEVSTQWPAPWLFSRVLFICLLCYFGFILALSCFPEHWAVLLPGWMFIGNFALPFSTIVLLFEFNVCRDYPFHRVAVAMCLGGVVAIICTLFITSNDVPIALAGLTEEPAKFLSAMLLGGGLYKKRILTGILLGGAVGAGFASFESAGYVFRHLIDDDALTDPTETLHLRAMLAPFMHIVWTSMVAGAFCRTVALLRKRGKNFTRVYHGFRVFAYASFVRIFATAILLHIAWNSQIFGLPGWILIGITGWAILLRIVYTGILQVREEQKSMEA